MELNKFVEEIKTAWQHNLRSIILYGSAAGEDFSKKHSDFNILIIVNDTSPEKISGASKYLRRWQKAGNPAPHIFDLNHINSSLDVFPIEFMDIKQRHKVLFGDDPFINITIDKKNIRHQCESELKGKLLHLRSFFAANADEPKRLKEMIVSSFPTFMAAFKGTILMTNEDPKQTYNDLILQLSKKIEIDEKIFSSIADARIGKIDWPNKNDMKKYFTDYLTQIEKVVKYVDEYQ